MAGNFIEFAASICDGDEMITCFCHAKRINDLVVKILEERERFYRAAGFGRYNENGFFQIQPFELIANSTRIGAIQNSKV